MLLQTGLVLEGGGMRGVYTAGILEYFLEHDIQFPYVIGVSAGACNGASYISKQKGRNKTVTIEYVTDPRYLSWKNYWKNKELFGMDFIFDTLPNEIVPFDYDGFFQNKTEFVVGTTCCDSGEPVYYRKKDYGNDVSKVLRASSSLPFVASEVEYNGKRLLDGGISDPIPLKQAQKDGYRKNVVILTRNPGYSKKPSKFHFLVKRKYRNYERLQETMANRYQVYNETLHYIEKERSQNNVLIIQPTKPLEVGRVERDQQKLLKLYEQGWEDAKGMHDKILNWVDK